MVAERKYQMVRVRAGDYLLVGNDSKTLYRITQYEETGDGYWIDARGREHRITGQYWQAAKYKGTLEEAEQDEELLEWNDDHYSWPDSRSDRWPVVAYQAKTRQQAIEWSGALS